MKTELRIAKHSVLSGHNIIEVWHNGKMIGQVTGADEPGVRVISKYRLQASVPNDPDIARVASVIEVLVK